MVTLTFKLPKEVTAEQWVRLLGELPENMQAQILGLKSRHSQEARLLGRHLVRFGLQKAAGLPFLFSSLRFGSWGRPYLEGGWDFNLTYSEENLVLVMAENFRVGVDAETVKSLRLADFQGEFSPEHWLEINRDPDPTRRLIQSWVRLESVLKADGRGLSFPARQVVFQDNVAEVEGKNWFIHELNLGLGNFCSVAVERPDVEMGVKSVELAELLQL